MSELRKEMNKLGKTKLPLFKKKILQEAGIKTKSYMVQNIDSAGLKFKGELRKSIHRRTMADRVSISVEHGGALAIERGYRPHFIHRNMLSGGGYKVGQWMNAKGMKNRNYVLVGTRQPAGGVRFAERAYNRIVSEIPLIIKNNLKELKR